MPVSETNTSKTVLFLMTFIKNNLNTSLLGCRIPGLIVQLNFLKKFSVTISTCQLFYCLRNGYKQLVLQDLMSYEYPAVGAFYKGRNCLFTVWAPHCESVEL